MKQINKGQYSTVLVGDAGERMRSFAVSVYHGSVEIVVRFMPMGKDAEEMEILQYLDPIEAMVFAKAFERFAVEALRNAA